MENACKGLCDICDSSDCITRAGTEIKINKSNYELPKTVVEEKQEQLKKYKTIYAKGETFFFPTMKKEKRCRTKEEQIEKIKEEVMELANYTDFDNMIEEIGDCLQSLKTLIDILGIPLEKVETRHWNKLENRKVIE